MNVRRMLGIGALGAAVVSLAAAPAQAELSSFNATSTGQALLISVGGQELTMGAATATITSGPQATAEGSGLIIPNIGGAGLAEADQSGDGSDGSPDEVCEAPIPPEPTLTIQLACGQALGEVAGGIPSASAAGRVAGLSANPVQTVLSTPLGDILGAVQGAVETLVAAIAPITGPVGDATGLDLNSTLDELFGSLFGGVPLATVTLGPTSVESLVVDGNPTTRCRSAGARIDVLDPEPIPGGIDPDPLMTIIVGESATEVVVDGTTGVATPTVNPSIVTVIVPTLNINQAVAGGTLDIPLPDPLTSRIVGADGSSGTNPDGDTFADASAVRVELATGLEGGIILALADCQSVASAAVAQVTTSTSTTTTTTEELPRTGGSTNSTALALSAGFAALALALLRKSSAVV